LNFDKQPVNYEDAEIFNQYNNSTELISFDKKNNEKEIIDDQL